MQTRAFVRATPRLPVTVAFEKSGAPIAYGAVANISEGGACVWTAADFAVGQEVLLRLSGARQIRPLAAPAVVTWEGDESRPRDTRRYGVRWVARGDGVGARLRPLLGL